MGACNTLRGQEAWTLALMRAQGREEEAQAYLDQLNLVQRAFGHPDYTMPEPLMTGEPDLVSYPADVQLTEPCVGDPLLRKWGVA